ncbi:MAG: hypothetical protein L0H24_12745, partial [Microlunatus sp.]|nr:hypothetical protein [Microlunatus sp.]
TLKYPKSLPKTNPTGRQVMLTTPWKAVAVSDWSSLYEPNRLFVLAPEELSIDDVQKWDDFGVNLNAKRPRDEEWRVERDPRGRGAQVGPANYPTAILWDGEHDADPLTFYLGLNLETGQRQTLTLNDASPHVACSGGTSSGKLIDLSTVLPAPSGWRQVGEIKVGDAIFDEAGQPVKVTAMSPVVTNPDAYRVTFHDGTTVDADGGHLWTTWDRSARRARSRQVCTVRARYPWLSDAQRALLSAELETTVHGEDVSVQQVIRLLGAESIWDRPFYETARTIGVCRSRQQNTTFVYADQVVEQRQTCTVIDRADGLALAEYMAGSASQRVKAASLVVRMMAAAEGGSVLTAPQLASATGMDRASVIGVLGRANVESLRKEQVTVALVVPAKTVTRVGMKVDHFYPKKAYLEALIERGLQPKNDQRHLMSMPKVRTTREIADTLRYCSAGAEEDAHSWANHSIPRAGAAQYPARVLPLDPYVMGAWLGDGTSNGGGFTSIDPEIWEQIEAAGFDVHHGSVPKAHYIRGLTKPLRAAGVLSNKHIPENYLLGSVEQRLALLQGLMDTDGSVNRTSGTCEFYQSDEALARQVRSLVASLGMIAHLRSKPGGYRTPGGTWVPCKQAWTVSFAPTMPVFRLARKMALIDPEAVRAKSEHRYIVAVDPIEPVPMRCLMVDSDTHQFLVTDQYVPTHNTSAAEIIAAQVLIKAMPWDPDLYGMVVIVDPKGPFARRWAGRPGVVVANGQMDSAEPDEDGNPITGPTVMANCMAWLEAEHIRRANVMARYADVATWVHLPDEVKRAERFCPILVVLDEYIDHTDIEKAHGDERVERENEARIATARMASWHARKYRNVGMHTFLIAQRVNMSIIGNTLMSNLPVRIITGQMDRSQTETMFGTSEVPSLPATRTVVESGERRVKTIPGRARIMNALGQAIHKVQVMWFGGATNSDTLDKWLPRGEVPVNGDFDPPTGKPRTRADFDADGNLITADSPAPPGLVSITADEPGEGDSDGDGVPDGLDLGTPDEVADPTEQEVTFGPDARPGLDPSAVFPA